MLMKRLNLPIPSEEELTQLMAENDFDENGSLDYAEFRKGLLSLGIVLSDEEFVALIDVLDNNRDGDIDYDEFLEDLGMRSGFLMDPLESVV